MGLQKIVVLCLILVVLGGGAWYLSQVRGDEANQTGQFASDKLNNAEKTDEDNRGPFSGLGSLTDLFGKGNNLKCDFSVSADGQTFSGTTYIDGDNSRYRMDANGNWGDGEGDFGVIGTAELMYWWGDTPEGKQGMKIATMEEAPVEGTAPVTHNFSGFDESMDVSGSPAAAPVSIDQEVEYDCDRWRVDSSKFEPPSDVTFNDVNQMYEQMMQGMPEGFEMPEGMPVAQ